MNSHAKVRIRIIYFPCKMSTFCVFLKNGPPFFGVELIKFNLLSGSISTVDFDGGFLVRDSTALQEYQISLFNMQPFFENRERKEISVLEPSVWDNFTFIDLFAGIGGIRLGFEHVGGKCVFSSEWDEQAAQTYYANFGELPSGDITKIASKDIPDFDILLGGFPCQPFSIIGDKEGFSHETQGTLFFEIERILRDKCPKAFLLENVRNLTAHDGGKTFQVIISHLKALGYHVYFKVLNALDYGVPQKRERIIICGFINNVFFDFPAPVPPHERLSLRDVLEDEMSLDKSLWVRECIKKSRIDRMKIKLERPYITHENVNGSITPHHFSCALRAGASANYILINNERRPSMREMLRLQGFPDTFKVVVSYSSLKKQIGNSVAVPVIRAVAGKMLSALKKYELEHVHESK